MTPEIGSSDPSRRTFLKMSAGAVGGVAAAAGFPTIVPASVFGQTSPSNRINVGAIGMGRISRVHDLPGVWRFEQARIVAVCDLDASRVEEGKKLINGYYAKKARQACLIHHIAMKTKRRLYWDPVKGHFKNDDEANSMLSRPQHAPYMMDV